MNLWKSMHSLAISICLLPLHAFAGDSFPSWGREALALANRERPPARADAWVLLDRTEYSYSAGGEIELHRYRVVQVLSPAGISEAIYSLHGLGGRSTKIKRLKGWNFRPGGEPVAIEKDSAFLVDPDSDEEITSAIQTTAVLPEVTTGCWLAWESVERLDLPEGPHAVAKVAERHPVLRWEFRASRSFWSRSDVKVRVMPWKVDAFTKEIENLSDGTLRISHVPAYPSEERNVPGWLEAQPLVFVSFDVPGSEKLDTRSWEAMGRGLARIHQVPPCALPIKLPDGASMAAKIEAVRNWVVDHIAYRQVYLAPHRTLMPLVPAVTLRRRYGDCKDMAALVSGGLSAMGVESHPALAQIGTGRIPSGIPVYPFVFNHVITAIPLAQSLGLPAEVEAGGHRYLLYDPTDTHTPFGYLGDHHRNGRMLVCHPLAPEWVTVPERAIFSSQVEATLDVRVDGEGHLTGSLLIREQGDALGLASTMKQRGRPRLEARLREWLAVNPSATVRVEVAQEPPRGKGIIEVIVALDLPEAWSKAGVHWRWLPLFIPEPTQSLHRFGSRRLLPIHQAKGPRWIWNARVEAPPSVLPAVPYATLETAFRRVDWKARRDKGALLLSLDIENKEAFWSEEQLPEGLVKADADRSQYEVFLASCLEFQEQLGQNGK